MAAKKKTSSVEDWLESIDLGHFAGNFLVNGLTELEQVCCLTEDQLCMLGITQRGYQKRILNHLPTEAEAFLSEFISGSAKQDTGAVAPVEEPPPPMPPRRTTPKQFGKENGHPTQKKPTFDDESYLYFGPGANPVLPTGRPHSQPDKASRDFPASSDASENIPMPPPRAPSNQGNRTAAPGIPKMRPTPQPRVRSDPSLPAGPPPLPVRDEKPERPTVKHRQTPQVPPRLAPSQVAPVVPSSDRLPAPLTVPNLYEDEPYQCVKPPEPMPAHFLTPLPILPSPGSQFPAQDEPDEHFPDLPPPPPPKSIPLSTSPSLAKRRVPPVPHPNHPTLPEPPSSDLALSQSTILTNNVAPSLSPLQMHGDGPVQPPKMSFLSPPPVLPFESVTPGKLEEDDAPFLSPPPPPPRGMEEDNMPSLPLPPPPSVVPTPSIPPRPPVLQDPSLSDAPLLPPKDASGQFQSSFPSPSLPANSPMPAIPPRPPPLSAPAPLHSELQPLPTQGDTQGYPNTIQPFQRDSVGILDSPSMPVIPPRPASDQFPSSLPPPVPAPEEVPGHPDTTQPLTTDTLNIFDSAKLNIDPFAFDPFSNPDDTDGTFTIDAPIRPPSLFLSPEDSLAYPTSQSSLPTLPEALPSVSEPQLPLIPSRPAPDLSLASRPVPLPPGGKVDNQPSTATSGVIPPVPPVRQDLTQSTVDQRSTGDILTRPATTGADGPPSAGLAHKTSNLIDLSLHDMDQVQFKYLPNENTDKSLLDTEFAQGTTQSTPSPSLPVVDQRDIEDQYSKVHRVPQKTAQLQVDPKKEPSVVPHIPARLPPIPPRQEPQGEDSPTFAVPERPSPVGAMAQEGIDNQSGFQEKRVASWSALQVPASPSSLSDGSDRHSYILLSESISGTQDTSNVKMWPQEHPALPSMPPLGSRIADKPYERLSPQFESEEPQKPVRPAPLPPVAKARERSPAHMPKIPSRPAPAVKEFLPQVPADRQHPTEDDYSLLDPSAMVYTSLLRDESLDSPEGIAFKELAQSEESGDDDSGFDMDSMEYSKTTPKQEVDSIIDMETCANRRSKLDLGHVLRAGQPFRPEVPHRPLARTHSRAVDENTRKRLSKKLSQALQEKNSNAEIPAKELTEAVTVLKKSGYLWKQGGKQNNKGFRKRWMDFDGVEMRYYENEKKLTGCKGIIPVGTMRNVKNLSGTPRPSFGDTRQYRITLETTGRSFHFAAETLDEGTLWANVLMQAIILHKPPPGGFPVGGDMSCPDKKGYVKIEGYFQKRFLAIKGEKFFIYNTEMDFESAVAILDIEMKLASVKELPKNKIQLATPGKIYIMTIENPQEVKEWIEAMKEAIQEGLSDHSVLEKVYQNHSNKYCADCSMKEPDWASINLGICICKNCSGLHRNLGVHVSKVRSLKMDTKVWTPSLVQLMLELGNKKSNTFWESNLNEDEKAVPDDTLDRRKAYVLNKYIEKKYCQSSLPKDKNIERALFKSASLGNLSECMQLVFCGASVSYKREDGKTACDEAKACNFPAVAEFLSQNVNTQSSSAKNSAVPKASPRAQRTTSVAVRHSAHESKQEFIAFSGYLYKTGNNKKEFLKRYCTLEHGIFSYFEDRNQPAKNSIEGIDMVLVALAEPRQGHKFCFEVYTSPGRTYLLSAETEEERKQWMKALAKIHSLECMWESLEDFEQAGFLHKKEGAASTNWQRLWFILKGKSLVSFSSAKDQLEEIDLRKLVSLSRQDSDSASTTDYSHTLSIVLPGKNIYLRAETKQAADCWYEAVNRVTSQGGTALEDQPLTADNVPIIVGQCLDFVATHEGIKTEGIYRLGGVSSVIRKISNSFMEDPRTARLKEEYTVHDVTGALKKFFRELPDPLLTSKLYKKWTEVASYQNHTDRLQWYLHLLGELPPVNSHTTKLLIGHLKTVADHSDFNKMTIRNLAAIFGPTLMASTDSSYLHAEHEIAVIADLITYYNWLYQVSEEQMAKEREKEQKYEEGLSKIKAARASEAFLEDTMIMDIYMGRKNPGNSINIQITKNHTANEVIQMVLEKQQQQQQLKQKQPNISSWGLFEIIAKGELERLIHGYEPVLPQALQWSQNMAADNYLCLKQNDLMKKIEPFMEQATLTDTVKYSESKKTFKKYTFELMNNMITYYKDKNANSANSWRVADMKIYVGVERKRSPPTKWGISFTVKDEEGIKAMCLGDENSYLFWLAGLLKSKKKARTSFSSDSVVDPSSLPYSSHALSFKSEHESAFSRVSRNFPSKMPFWRKSRAPSMDDS